MSSYRARQDRKALKRKIDTMERRHQYEMGEARGEIADLLHAIARNRYDRPVRWDINTPVSVDRVIKDVPRIELKLFAKRQVLDVRMMQLGGRERMVRMLEQQVADEIARAMIAADLVAMDRARVPVRGDPYTEEYDWAVYVGLPVKKDDA